MSVAVRWLDRIAAVPAADWDALRGNDHPFVAHAFLDALVQRLEHGDASVPLLLGGDGVPNT